MYLALLRALAKLGKATVNLFMCWILPRKRNVSDKSCRENQNIHFMFSMCFSEGRNVYEIMWKNMVQTDRHWWKHNTQHAHCMLDNQGYKHRPRLCNTYCLSTATMVARTRLNIMLRVHCLSCSFRRRLSRHSSVSSFNSWNLFMCEII